MSRRDVIAWELVIVLLLALVLTVEWWRTGELDDLNRRVDELETARAKRATTTNTRRRRAATKPPTGEVTK